MAEAQPSFVAGLSVPNRSDDAANLLQMARVDGYDFVTTSLPTFASASSSSSSDNSPPPRKDITSLESKWWSTSVVGAVSDPPGFASNGPDGDSNMAVEGEEGGGNDADKDNYGLNLVSALSSGSGPGSGSASSTAAGGGGASLLAGEAERHINFMVEWAGHMSIPAVILPPVPSDPAEAAHYARLLTTIALQCSSTNVQLWVRTDANRPALEAFDLLHRRTDGASNLGCLLCFAASPTDTAAGGSPGGLSATNVGLSMTLVHQFVGSNLRAVSFATSVFLTNKRGYPTLSKSHQVLFTELLRRLGRTLRVLVEGMPLHHIPLPSGAPGHNVEATGQTGCLAYLQYLRHLRTRSEVTDMLDSEESTMETTYLDHLQSPLQPLGDNLEFQTYETFEKDPVKYVRYGLAVQLAVRDGISTGRLGQVNDTVPVNILVVGAGRGPLVRAALGAVAKINGSIQGVRVVPTIVAVEKNASAVLYLNSLQSREPSWKGTVTVVECDMRFADSHPVLKPIIATEARRADIVVSELLGSFGDNELSPECLDGVQRSGLLKAGCISIPQRYTSYIAPVSSMRLHSEANAQAYSPSDPTDGPSGKPCGTLQAMETPYVVRSHAACQTNVELPCWEFVHPKPPPLTAAAADSEGDAAGRRNGGGGSNDRSTRLVFQPDVVHGAGSGSGYGAFDAAVAAMSAGSVLPTTTPSSVTIHGFLGTFHSTLYQSQLGEKETVTISIAPSTFSVGMFSWFPLYFPLREPLHVPSGGSVGFTMWRRSDGCSDDANKGGGGGRVWYEWCAEVSIDAEEKGGSPARRVVVSASPVHNPNGRSYHVRL